MGSKKICFAGFQSTLPARGATLITIAYKMAEQDFNPRSPHGERPFGFFKHCAHSYFNPRSPHGERLYIELPTLRSDNFNPRSPHGERLKNYDILKMAIGFQSTLPARGATLRLFLLRICVIYFNPRSPHGERQRKVTILSIRIIGFAQKVYHKTVLLRISLAENAVILPKRPQNPVRTSLQKAGGLRFARAIRAARPYSISSPSGA